MENNIAYFKAAWSLVQAARELRTVDDELAFSLLEIADDLRKKVSINEEENQEIEKYVDILKNESVHD